MIRFFSILLYVFFSVWTECQSLSQEFLARRCINMQTLGTLQSSHMVGLVFNEQEPNNCKMLKEGFLMYQQFAVGFSEVFQSEADQNCYYLGALDGAYKALAQEIGGCFEGLILEKKSCEDYFPAENSNGELKLSQQSLTEFRGKVLSLDNPENCFYRLLDRFTANMHGGNHGE